MKNDLYNLVDSQDFSKEDLKRIVKELSFSVYDNVGKTTYKDIIDQAKENLKEIGILED